VSKYWVIISSCSAVLVDADLLQQRVLLGDAVGNRLALSGHTLTVQTHRLRFGLCLSHAFDLVGLGKGLRCDTCHAGRR
jgi:hypothetical protein